MTPTLRPEDLTYLDRAQRVYVFEAPVAAAPDAVFSAISADPSTWTWFPGLARGSYESAAPHGVGSIREVAIGGTTYRETIIGWDPPGLWAYRVDESSVPLAHALIEEWAILDDPAGSGRTIVRWTFAIDPKPLFRMGQFGASIVMGTLFRKAMANLSRQLMVTAD